MFRVFMQIAERDDVETLAGLPNIENEGAVLKMFVRCNALSCLEYAIITWPRVVHKFDYFEESLLVCICRQACTEWERLGLVNTRWNVKRTIRICDLIAKERKARDRDLMRILSYAHANPHTRAFGSYLIDMGYVPTSVVNNSLGQYVIRDYARQQDTLLTLRKVRVLMFALLCKKRGLPKDVAKLVAKDSVLWQRDTWRVWDK